MFNPHFPFLPLLSSGRQQAGSLTPECSSRLCTFPTPLTPPPPHPAHCTSAQKSCKSKPHTGQREEFHPEKRKQEEKSAMSKRKVWQMKHMHHMAAHSGSRPGRQEHITLIAHQASLTTTSSGGKRLGENQPKIDSTHTHNDFTPAPCSLNKCCMIAGVLLSWKIGLSGWSVSMNMTSLGLKWLLLKSRQTTWAGRESRGHFRQHHSLSFVFHWFNFTFWKLPEHRAGQPARSVAAIFSAACCCNLGLLPSCQH